MTKYTTGAQQRWNWFAISEQQNQAEDFGYSWLICVNLRINIQISLISIILGYKKKKNRSCALFSLHIL